MILTEPPVTDLVLLTDQARDYARQSQADITLRVYRIRLNALYQLVRRARATRPTKLSSIGHCPQ